MKLKVLSHTALVLAGAFGGSAFAASDLPHVYGRMDVSVNSTELGGADSSINTNSNASRLGFQNTHALNDDLSVFYRLEFEINPDERLRSSSKGMLRQRNSVVGLKGSYGKVFVGVHDTPMKKAELKVDLFSDYHLADMDEVLAGQDRTSDTINYVSPKFGGGFQAWVMLIPGDDKSGDPGTDSTADSSDAVSGDGVADAVSASVTYKTKPLQLALAYNSDVGGQDIIRASAQYKVGPAKLGAIVQRAENADGTGEDGLGFVASAAVNVTKDNIVKLQYTSADDKSVEETAGADMLTIGWDHKLAKKTKLYAYYSELSHDDATKEFNTFGVGIQHKFGKSK